MTAHNTTLNTLSIITFQIMMDKNYHSEQWCGMIAIHNTANYIFKAGFYFMAIILSTLWNIPPHSEASTAIL
jgi:hypothetical protein